MAKPYSALLDQIFFSKIGIWSFSKGLALNV